MSKTIKQIADELGVDKQRVYRFVVKNNITASSEVKQSKLYDDAAESLIRDHFLSVTASGNPHQKHIDDVLIERLLSQLDVKDRQIKQLQDSLDKQIEINKELAQSINADRKNELAGTIKELLPEAAPEEPVTEAASETIQDAAPRKWWQFWK